jgi:hypothetical protein
LNKKSIAADRLENRETIDKRECIHPPEECLRTEPTLRRCVTTDMIKDYVLRRSVRHRLHMKRIRQATFTFRDLIASQFAFTIRQTPAADSSIERAHMHTKRCA